MKALTLYQPHALAIRLGYKPYETRPRRTHHRGLLAIHAAKIQRRELDGLVINPDEDRPKFAWPWSEFLPADYNAYFGDTCHGSIECIVHLEDCRPAPEVEADMLRFRETTGPGTPERKRVEAALSCGDFGAGRWAYKLQLICAVEGLGVLRGYQGFWDLPADYEQRLRALAAEQGVELE